MEFLVENWPMLSVGAILLGAIVWKIYTKREERRLEDTPRPNRAPYNSRTFRRR
jgi:hypothetical protein